MSIYTREKPVSKPLTEQQRRIKGLFSDERLLERLADRTQPLPESLNLETMLKDLSQVLLGQSDAMWPMR